MNYVEDEKQPDGVNPSWYTCPNCGSSMNFWKSAINLHNEFFPYKCKGCGLDKTLYMKDGIVSDPTDKYFSR